MMAKKHFDELSEREILALAITNEEEDSRIYDSFADGLKENFPASASIFENMAEEERGHRNQLLDLYKIKFGEKLPLVRREDVRGFIQKKPYWLVRPLGLDEVRKYAELMEFEAARFYELATARSTDVSIRKLLGDLAAVEKGHAHTANALREQKLGEEVLSEEEETRHRLFVMQYVQPGLAGLMDGSVSTLAPVFAAAFATQSSWDAFLVGMAASVGAGISMGLTEALSDDGIITGRGSAWLRGTVCGVMTTLGGLGHTLPYLIPDFYTATTIAILITLIELWVISWIRYKYMDTPFLKAAFQIVVGGLLVFLTGILIGHG